MNDLQLLFRPLEGGRSELRVVHNPDRSDPQSVADSWPQDTARLLGNRDLVRLAVGMIRRGYVLEAVALRNRRGRRVAEADYVEPRVMAALARDDGESALALLAAGALQPLFITDFRLGKPGAATQVTIDKFGRTSLTPVTADSSEEIGRAHV